MARVAVRNKRAPELLRVLMVMKECLDTRDVETGIALYECVDNGLVDVSPKTVFKNRHQILSVLRRENFIVENDKGNLVWNKEKQDFPNIHTARKVLTVIGTDNRARGKQRYIDKKWKELTEVDFEEDRDGSMMPEKQKREIACATVSFNGGQIAMEATIREGNTHVLDINGVAVGIRVFRKEEKVKVGE